MAAMLWWRVRGVPLAHQRLWKISATALEGLPRPISPPRTPDPRTALAGGGHSLQEPPPSCGNGSPGRMLEPIRQTEGRGKDEVGASPFGQISAVRAKISQHRCKALPLTRGLERI